MASLTDSIKVTTQYLIPKKLLSIFLGSIAKSQLGFFTAFLIRIFIKRYKIDMSLAKIQDIKQFKCFNDFFTRELQDNARPITAGADIITQPADGKISELGPIDEDSILQAKGRKFSLKALLGGDGQDSKHFESGSFATIYLAPSDYHRYHMPCDGRLEKVIFIPGDLFSVNPLIAQNVDNLFARNERAVCFFNNDKIGKFALVLVGAAVVSGISLVFNKDVLCAKSIKTQTYDYSKDNICLKKGDELGRFFLGSTVICVFPKNKIELDTSLAPGTVVRMGGNFAKIV